MIVTIKLRKSWRPLRGQTGHPAMFVPGELIGVRPDEADVLIQRGFAEAFDLEHKGEPTDGPQPH